MNPQVEAALIAGIVSLISLGGTVVVALRGFHASKQAAETAAHEAHKDTAGTLAAQREQLDKTLAEQHVRTLNERFATAAGQLGTDKSPSVRLAGVHAMAGLADDWEENRQTCIDVLCGYLRMPYEPNPGPDVPAAERLAFQDNREVRHTVIRVITAHLKTAAAKSWEGFDLDFTGVVFDGGNFSGARFTGGFVRFDEASFPGGEVFFVAAEFSRAWVSFRGAKFSGAQVSFFGARFSGDDGNPVDFSDAEFSGGEVSFISARFSGSLIGFERAGFSGGKVSFDRANFSGSKVFFNSAGFSGGQVDFSGAEFSGGQVDFSGAEFSGGQVDFSEAGDWSHPPRFDWDSPAPEVTLPTAVGKDSE